MDNIDDLIRKLRERVEREEARSAHEDAKARQRRLMRELEDAIRNAGWRDRRKAREEDDRKVRDEFDRLVREQQQAEAEKAREIEKRMIGEKLREEAERDEAGAERAVHDLVVRALGNYEVRDDPASAQAPEG